MPTSESEGEQVLGAEPAPSPDLEPAPDKAVPSYVATEMAPQWLEALAQVNEVTAYKTLSYDLLSLARGMKAIDLGCGIGDDARNMVGLVEPGGTVTGIDANAEMIRKAKERLSAEGSEPVHFLVGDGAQLPVEDASYDALRVDRMLQHVAEPLQVLSEIRRVLRPGGRVVLIEPDWKTMAIYPGGADQGDDDSVVAALLKWHVEYTAHPTIGRQLRALLRQAGFSDITVFSRAYSTTVYPLADLVLELSSAADGVASAESPAVTREDIDRWVETARAADAAGDFFATVPLFFARAVAS